MKIIYSMYLVGLLALITSCADYPVKRGKNYTAIDRTERCTYRLVERNGVNATEAEKVCTKIFKNRN
jgi:hypothetical protein